MEGGGGSMIPQPETLKEPMEFLSRSWSLSALEISKALQANKKQNKQNSDIEMIVPEKLMFAASYQQQHRVSNVVNSVVARHSTARKWFHSAEDKKSKEKVRAEKAQIHAAVTVASVAAAVAAAMGVSASLENECLKMIPAMASATELLASHCIEIAEQAGAERERLTSAVRSAVDVRTPGDLMTLTAAAATALRGAAALKMRMQREAKNNAAVIPCEKSQCGSPDIWCKAGDLIKRSRKGSLQWIRASIYINKKSQVIVKLKSKLLGGALTKKKKSVVYGVCDEVSTWSSIRAQQQDAGERQRFGLRTAHGLVEFECESEVSKQKWMDGVNNILLRQANRRGGGSDRMEKSFQLLNLR